MGRQSAGVTFGVIGHQDSWLKVGKFVNAARLAQGNPPVPLDTIKDIYGFLPPRTVMEVEVASRAKKVSGWYIETFISPDELDVLHMRQNLNKVREACTYAATLGADIVSLGGFTSILLEAGGQHFTRIMSTTFTTGNTLTASFIADGVHAACEHWNLPLNDATMLIIGSTGDIGSACARYFANRVQKLLLNARLPGPLMKQEAILRESNPNVQSSQQLNELLPYPDIVICVASSVLPQIAFNLLPAHTIICDAGYPKNLDRSTDLDGRHVFHGGMGIIQHGYHFTPAYTHDLYDLSPQHIAHGCIIESMVLALEGRPVPWSRGRGNISVQSMTDIKTMAARHDIYCAPLFNHTGFLVKESVSQA